MVVNIVLGVAVLALLIYRQLIARPVNASTLRILVILGVVGVVQTAQFLGQNHSSVLTYGLIAGSLVLAAAFGALRAATVRIWIESGQAWSRGNWLTALLWVAAVAAHLGSRRPGGGRSRQRRPRFRHRGSLPGHQSRLPAHHRATAGPAPAARRPSRLRPGRTAQLSSGTPFGSTEQGAALTGRERAVPGG